VTHKLIADLRDGGPSTTTRKSVTLTATSPNDPDFLLRRIVRRPSLVNIKQGLLNSGPVPLPPADLKILIEKRSVQCDNLCAWPPQYPLMKLVLSRHKTAYTLAAIDERSFDSYFLKSRDWEQVRLALFEIADVQLATPAILEVYNPFGLYAPFDVPPSQVDFESVNNKLLGQVQEGLEKLRASGAAGILEGKVALEYYRIMADLQRLNAVVALLSTPSADHFENDYLEF